MSSVFCIASEPSIPLKINEYVLDEYNCIDLHDTPCTTDCKCCICNITTGNAPIYSAPLYSKPIEIDEPINIEVNEVNNELIENDDAISIEWCNYDCDCEICSFIASDAYTSINVNVIPTHCIVSKIETETCIIWITQHGSPNQDYDTECNCFGVEMEVDTDIDTALETTLETALETALETEFVEVIEDSNE